MIPGGQSITSGITNRINGLCALLLLVLWYCGASSVSAAEDDVLVIGHPQLNIDVVNLQVIRDLYLGKTVQLVNGTRVEIVDLPAGHQTRDKFYIEIIGRDPGQMRAYWAKRIFTGKGRPPDTLSNERSVLRWVASEPGRIGYISAGLLDDSVRVLYTVRHDGDD